MKYLICAMLFLAGTILFFSNCKKEDNGCPDCPVITALTPNFGLPKDTITISGKNFDGLQSVKFDGVEAEVRPGSSGTMIRVVVPNLNKTGAVDVLVERDFQSPSGGTAVLKSEEVGFTYAPLAPIISGMSPSSGTAGTVVSITGSRFENLKAVRFGGVNATVQNNSATSITVTVPSLNVSGEVPVVAVTEYTLSGSALQENPSDTFSFVYQGPMNITSFSPQAGKKGDVVTISGSGFGNSSSGITVSFNGISATVQSVNDAEIRAIVPAKAGTGKITVSKGIALAVSQINFKYYFSHTVLTHASLQDYPLGVDHFNGKAVVSTASGSVTRTYASSLYELSASGATTKYNTDVAGTSFLKGGGFRPNGNYYFVSNSGGLCEIYSTQYSASILYSSWANQALDILWTSLFDVKLTGYLVNYSLSDYNTSTGWGTEYLTACSSTIDGPIPRCGVAYGLASYDGETYFVQENSLRKISNNQIITIAGKQDTPGFVNGTFGDARFNEMRGLAITADGRVYVADSNNHCIRLIDLSTGEVSLVAGAGAVPGSADGPSTTARFNRPLDLCLDSEGNLLVADNLNKAIRKIIIE